MPVKFSIFAAKLPNHSLARHLHEFRHAHAIQTVDSALMSGGIDSYTQGFVPIVKRLIEDELAERHASLTFDALLPLPKFYGKPLTVVTILDFPSLTVIDRTFKSPMYQATSGAHLFAIPQVIYITEALESLDEQAQTFGIAHQSAHARTGLARVRLIVALAPAASDNDTFKQQWDAHARKVHALVAEFVAASEPHPLAQLPLVEYQRHQCVPLSQTEMDGVLDGSPFREAPFRVASGGYEELAFLHFDLLIAFLTAYGETLRASYGGFIKIGSEGQHDAFTSFAVVCDEARLVDQDAIRGVDERPSKAAHH